MYDAPEAGRRSIDRDYGFGWAKYLSSFDQELAVLGYYATGINSKNGVFVVEGPDYVPPAAQEAIKAKKLEMEQRCEYCWLGGREKVVKGRCSGHSWEMTADNMQEILTGLQEGRIKT